MTELAKKISLSSNYEKHHCMIFMFLLFAQLFDWDLRETEL